MKNRGFTKLFFRALLGGAFGGFVFVAGATTLQVATSGGNWFGWLVLSYLAAGLPYGLSIGGIVGVAIWLVALKTGAKLGPLIRIIIGAITATIAWQVVWWFTEQRAYVQGSWASTLLALIVFGGTFGAIPGLISGTPQPGKLGSATTDNLTRDGREET